MSIFTPAIYNEPSFSGLFRLLDDFDTYRAASSPNTSGANNGNNQQQQQQQQRQLAGPRYHSHLPTFNPKFDLQETATAYELHGELPGIAKDQIHIEFADPNTLTIRGKVERSYTKSSGSDVDGKEKAVDAPTNNNEQQTSTDVTTTSKDHEKQVSSPAQGFKPRYWISERSVGEFSRSFNLAGGASGNEEIDHDGVKASLNDGVLHVVVPKVKKEEKQAKRRIAIE